MINLSEWMDRHEVMIDDLGQDRVADACREALRINLVHDATIDYIYNNKTEVVDELISEMPDLDPDEALGAIEAVVKKNNDDWRILILNSDGEYDDFYDEHEPEFAEWLKEQGKKVFDDLDEMKEYYLSEGIDDFLEFAYEFLGGKNMFNYEMKNVLDVIDWEDLVEIYEDGFEEYFSDNIEYFEDLEWFMDWVYSGHSGDIEDYITPDDYYPIWSYAWEFPTTEAVEDLNSATNGRGLIFFELNGVVYLSLATVGMSMMPAIYYAYYMYSELDIDPEEIANGIVREGPGYWEYVIGSERLIELTEKIGYDLKELQKISEQKYKEFDEMLKALSKEVKEGNMDRLEAGMLGMMAVLREPDTKSAKSL